MKRSLTVGSLAILLAYTSPVSAQMAKEGVISSNTVFTGSSVVLAIGNERIQINYEGTGLSLNSSGEGFGHFSTWWCVGSLQAVKGQWDNESGLCQATFADGDKTYSTYQAKGAFGNPVKGTWQYVGGTGKYEGITGGGEFTRISGRPAKEGTFQSNNINTGTYKLP